MRPWVFWLVALLPLIGFWTYGLFDLDEGFYAAVISEMSQRGEWILPYYNGSLWFEKPILLYWITIPFTKLISGELGLRLPGVLCTIGCYWLVFWFVRKLKPERAQPAVLVLATSLLMVAVGRMLMTDVPLVLSLSVALAFFYVSLDAGPQLRAWVGVALGLAVLAKGPVGVILFAAIVGLFLLRNPESRVSAKGGWIACWALMLAVVACWYVPAYLQASYQFVDEFLIKQNIGRFTGGDVAHTLPGPEKWVVYLPVLLVGFAPWWWWLGRAVRDTSARSSADKRLLSFLLIWASVPLLFFTISGAKLPHYILPCFVPLAMIVGVFGLPWPTARNMAVCMSAGLVLVANLGFSWWYRQSHERLDELATLAGRSGRPVFVYQMSRRESDRGTGGLQLRETSHPSIRFYVGRNVLIAETPDEVFDGAMDSLLITRPNRIDAEFRAKAMAKRVSIEPVFTDLPREKYVCFRLVRTF